VPAPVRETLPDSVAVLAADGRLLVRSSAVLYVLQRLGGFWGVPAALGRLVPVPLRDRLYDAAARLRRRLFAAPPETCPLVPPPLRGRFLP
jgi:predicted DCC family thiol-disulfide oxidoreductase YuxK